MMQNIRDSLLNLLDDHVDVGVLALERATHELGREVDLVAGLADLDRVAQQLARFRGRLASQLVLGPGRRQVAVDRRRTHRLQFVAHLRGMVAHEGVEKLVAQMTQDVDQARDILAATPSDR